MTRCEGVKTVSLNNTRGERGYPPKWNVTFLAIWWTKNHYKSKSVEKAMSCFCTTKCHKGEGDGLEICQKVSHIIWMKSPKNVKRGLRNNCGTHFQVILSSHMINAHGRNFKGRQKTPSTPSKTSAATTTTSTSLSKCTYCQRILSSTEEYYRHATKAHQVCFNELCLDNIVKKGVVHKWHHAILDTFLPIPYCHFSKSKMQSLKETSKWPF